MDSELVLEHVDDIIDARSQRGEYDELVSSVKPQCVNARYTYSYPANQIRDDLLNYSEGDNNNDPHFLDLATTESDVTVIRVKREGSKVRTSPTNNWNLQDKSIPGDGTHLADSPSLVNLVTMVVPSKQNIKHKKSPQEFMVPLSSWEPTPPPDGEQEVKIMMPTSNTSIAKKNSFRDMFSCFMFWRGPRRNTEKTVVDV